MNLSGVVKKHTHKMGFGQNGQMCLYYSGNNSSDLFSSNMNSKMGLFGFRIKAMNTLYKTHCLQLTTTPHVAHAFFPFSVVPFKWAPHLIHFLYL